MPVIYLMMQLRKMNKDKKEKKEKVTYYDDGRTVANMDNVKGSFLHSSNNKQLVSEKDKLKTFFKAFKMMLIPTGVALLVLLILYLFFLFLGTLVQ